MTLTTTSGSVLIGDWRSGSYGGNRKAHLFVYRFGETRKATACYARVSFSTTAQVTRRKTSDLCYDCLVYGASHA